MDLSFLIDMLTPVANVILLSIARPYGFTMTFIVFAWFRADTGMVRMGVAIALGVPIFAYAGPQEYELINSSEIPVLILLLKEILIGAIMGWLVSFPLLIASGAGGIIDTYSGGSQGTTDPTGGQVTPVAHLFMITTLGLFATVGGFWIVTDLLYESYATWPIYTALPDITAGIDIIFSMITSLVAAAFILAAPILAVMFFSDIIFLIAAKLGKKINVTFLAFTVKSTIVILLLPVFTYILVQADKKNFEQFSQVSVFLRSLL